jgi:transcriptional regulator with XRE-family HTH domain
MATRERRADQAKVRARRLVATLVAEIRSARLGAGLSLRDVAAAAGTSEATMRRLERLDIDPTASLLARVGAALGLDLALRYFPTGSPVRDRAHIQLLAAFRARLSPTLRWETEVPLPIERDLRRWDGMVSGPAWRSGVEAETAPRDWQALAGRIQLKQRDGRVDGVILVLPETHRSRDFLRAAAPLVATVFPIPARLLLARLGTGENPGGSGIVVLRPSRPGSASALSATNE